MQHLSSTEIENKIASSGEFIKTIIYTPPNKRGAPFLCFLIPQEAGRKMVLSKTLAKLFDFKELPLMWIASTGVWPSAEHPELFIGYRRGTGETRNEVEAPGIQFAEGDEPAFVAFTSLALFFSWDFWLIEPGYSKSCFELSHDDILSIWVSDDTLKQRVKKELTQLKLKDA